MKLMCKPNILNLIRKGGSQVVQSNENNVELPIRERRRRGKGKVK
jgi:hypothetical protein